MYLVFDIGGTFVKYALMTIEGTIVEKSKMPTKNKSDDDADTFIQSLVEIYEQYRQSQDIEGIALSLPGQIDVENGIVYVGGALPFLHEVHLADILSERCDHLPVAMENDAKCAALAEVWQGNANDCTNACLMIIGTGVGGGVVINRRVHRGNGLLAGELSWIVDNLERQDLDEMMCFKEADDKEALFKKIISTKMIASTSCSATALCECVAEKKNMDVETVNGELVYQWAHQGDQIAIDALEDLYFNIAKQCCNMYLIVDPDIILIGGGISAQPDFIEGIKRYVSKFREIMILLKDMRVEICKFGNDSNMIGALYNYMQKFGLVD